MDVRDVARFEERRLGIGVGEVARHRMAVAGGFAARDTPGTWANTAAGLGLDGPVTADDIDRLISWYADAGIEPRVEVCPYADRSLLSTLATAGFSLHSFEQVLYRTLKPGDRFEAPHPPPDGLEINVVDTSDDAAARTFATAVVTGFATPERPRREADIELATRCVRHHRSVCFTAHLDGAAVAAGAMELHGSLVALYGLSVLPAYRRRGIQQALIAARLARARERGCTLATISGEPGGGTERNVRRFGFQTAYTRAVLVRPGEGLVPQGGAPQATAS